MTSHDNVVYYTAIELRFKNLGFKSVFKDFVIYYVSK